MNWKLTFFLRPRSVYLLKTRRSSCDIQVIWIYCDWYPCPVLGCCHPVWEGGTPFLSWGGGVLTSTPDRTWDRTSDRTRGYPPRILRILQHCSRLQTGSRKFEARKHFRIFPGAVFFSWAWIDKGIKSFGMFLTHPPSPLYLCDSGTVIIVACPLVKDRSL